MSTTEASTANKQMSPYVLSAIETGVVVAAGEGVNQAVIAGYLGKAITSVATGHAAAVAGAFAIVDQVAKHAIAYVAEKFESLSFLKNEYVAQAISVVAGAAAAYGAAVALGVTATPALTALAVMVVVGKILGFAVTYFLKGDAPAVDDAKKAKVEPTDGAKDPEGPKDGGEDTPSSEGV